MTIGKDFIGMKPEYGVNYGAGYLGACFGGKAISYGITYLTRDHRISDIPVSHVFTVKDEFTCIESVMSDGVVETPLSQYFESEMPIFFRKPSGYTIELGERIAEATIPKIGEKYDKGLIAAQALRGTMMGRIINNHCDGRLDELISRHLNEEDSWICAELAAFAMNVQPEFKGVGILRKPVWTIDPQELFECDQLFTPWHFDK